MLLCVFALNLPAALVTGNLTDISLSPLNTKLTFAPTNDVLVTATGLSAGPPKTIDTTNGAFAIVLDAGDYVCTLPLITWRRPFLISVPPSTNSYNITNLLADPRTYSGGNSSPFGSSNGIILLQGELILSNAFDAKPDAFSISTTNGLILPTGQFTGNGVGLTNLPNSSLQNSSITVSGTAHRITVASSPVALGGSLTLGAPQDLDTNSAVQFAALGLGIVAGAGGSIRATNSLYIGTNTAGLNATNIAQFDTPARLRALELGTNGNLYVSGTANLAAVNTSGSVSVNGQISLNSSGSIVANNYIVATSGSPNPGFGGVGAMSFLSANGITLQGTTNQVIFGATNTAPASTAAPVKWISVQVSGDSTAYRLPLYQ